MTAPTGSGGVGVLAVLPPELPLCKWLTQLPRGYENFPYYTADQMRAIRDAGIEYGRRLASSGGA